MTPAVERALTLTFVVLTSIGFLVFLSAAVATVFWKKDETGEKMFVISAFLILSGLGAFMLPMFFY